MYADHKLSRRRSPRLQAVGSRIRIAAKGTRITAHCADIGMGGFGAVVPGGPQLGEEVEVYFSFPGFVQRIKLRAVVRNIRGFHYSFAFLDPQGPPKLLIEIVIQEFARTHLIPGRTEAQAHSAGPAY
jgi:PilZ domain-containing protein